METGKPFKYSDGAFVIFFLAALVMGGGLYFGYRLQLAHSSRRAQERIAHWAEIPRLAAAVMIEKYGPPDLVGAHALTWFGRSPWKRIVAHEEHPYSPLEQVVAYDLKPEAVQRIQAFAHGVRPDLQAAELSARGDSETLNILALNLADEVASGARGVQEARALYAKTAELAASGKSSAYAEGLLFEPYRPDPAVWTRGMTHYSDFQY